jgi:hypothetical protein
MIRVVHPESGSCFSFYPSLIPDSGVKKAPDPGSAHHWNNMFVRLRSCGGAIPAGAFFGAGSRILKSGIRIRIRIRINVMRIHNTAFWYNIFVRLRPGGGVIPAGEPAAEFCPSRIRIFSIPDTESASKNFSILTQKIGPGCSSRIRILIFLHRPDPGLRGQVAMVSYGIFVRIRSGGGAVPAGEPAAGEAAAGAGEGEDEDDQDQHDGHEEAAGGLQGGQGAAGDQQAQPGGLQKVPNASVDSLHFLSNQHLKRDSAISIQ